MACAKFCNNVMAKNKVALVHCFLLDLKWNVLSEMSAGLTVHSRGGIWREFMWHTGLWYPALNIPYSSSMEQNLHWHLTRKQCNWMGGCSFLGTKLKLHLFHTNTMKYYSCTFGISQTAYVISHTFISHTTKQRKTLRFHWIMGHAISGSLIPRAIYN